MALQGQPYKDSPARMALTVKDVEAARTMTCDTPFSC